MLDPSSGNNVQTTNIEDIKRGIDKSTSKHLPFSVDSSYSDPSLGDSDEDELFPELSVKNKDLKRHDTNKNKSTLEEYKPIITSNMLDEEKNFLPHSGNFSIKDKYRKVIIDWMIRLCESFSFVEDTLYTSIDLFDRICLTRQIPKQHIQLYSAASLWLASKMEETLTPTLSDFIYLCDNRFNEKEFIGCERQFCRALSFSFYSPNPRTYILSMASDPKYKEIRHFALFFSKIAFFAAEYNITESSVISLACIYLATLVTRSSRGIFKDQTEFTGAHTLRVCGFAKQIVDAYGWVKTEGSENMTKRIHKELTDSDYSVPVVNEQLKLRIKASDLSVLL